ncbi:hypothetical protein [Hyphobacterium sp.]|uniref:hypothetical protein n=1 Tax=Hyphobacterium sp. TaxID=2004662 RepID=UPI003BAA5FFE
MNRLKFLIFLLLVAMLSACATTTSLPIAAYSPESTGAPRAASFNVIVTATPMTERRRPSVYNEIQPVQIDLQPSFFAVIEQDLTAILAEHLNGSEDGVLIRATVRDGTVYQLRNPAENLPFVGLATVNRNRLIVANVEILFEVERNGIVENTFPFEHTVEVRGSMATLDLMAESVATAIEALRDEGWPRIESEFLERYIEAAQ